jgi:hypothetical protein
LLVVEARRDVDSKSFPIRAKFTDDNKRVLVSPLTL